MLTKSDGCDNDIRFAATGTPFIAAETPGSLRVLYPEGNGVGNHLFITSPLRTTIVVPVVADNRIGLTVDHVSARSVSGMKETGEGGEQPTRFPLSNHPHCRGHERAGPMEKPKARDGLSVTRDAHAGSRNLLETKRLHAAPLRFTACLDTA